MNWPKSDVALTGGALMALTLAIGGCDGSTNPMAGNDEAVSLAASARAPSIQHIRLVNQEDPVASAAFTELCGVPIVNIDNGHMLLITKFDKNGNVTRELLRQSAVSTITNTATGQSLTTGNHIQFTFPQPLVVLHDDGSQTLTFSTVGSGLNYLIRTPNGVLVSAGRVTQTVIVVLDPKGDVVSFDVSEHMTPNLTHFDDVLCSALGVTAP